MLVSSALTLALLLPTVDSNRQLPVQSITAFKDGHALVVREGTHDVVDGAVLLDGLPNPLLGTFWPYATDKKNHVVAATAAMIPKPGVRIVASVEELLERNTGRTVFLATESGGNVTGEVLGVTGGSPRHVLVQSAQAENVTATPITSVRHVSLEDGSKYEVETESQVSGLRLKLKNGDVDQAGVGLMYVQKGFRWIPQYRMALGPDGKAEYVLRATLVNDIIDIEDATVNLVVGVPMFAFAGQIDPISLNANIAQVGRSLQISNGFTNRLQSQIMSNSADYAMPQRGEAQASPEVTGGKRNEDLYVFTVEHVTLKQGERMSIEVARGSVEYDHYFQVDLPVLPPAELGNVNQQQKEQVAKLLAQPKVKHELKVHNTGSAPLTTAPTLLFNVDEQGRETLLAQSLQTYTPPGGDSRIDLGIALEFNVQFDEEEVDREVEVRKHGGYQFDRVNLKGTITVCNHRPVKSTLVVRRYVPGPIDEVSDDGSMKTLAPFDSDSSTAGLSGGNITANWWYGYRPNWYSALNPISRAEWTLELDPEEVKEPTYEWHYFWRW